jgi:hypothetical protein
MGTAEKVAWAVPSVSTIRDIQLVARLCGANSWLAYLINVRE